MMINLDSIDSNPNRDFGLDPIDPEKVSQLAESIGAKDDKTALGFWGGIVVRPSGNGRYQLAFGHHRLDALKMAGWTKADINKVDYDEDQMVKAMIKENLTQRGAEGGAATESVAAVIRHLGYKLLTQTDEELCTGKIFPMPAASAKARQAFLNGDGIGHSVITNYEPSLPVASVKNALKTLKASNWMFGIIVAIQEKIEAEAEAAAEAAKTFKQKAKKEAAEEESRKLKADAKNAEKAAENAKREQHFDPLVESILSREAHITKFRELVTAENGKKYIPLEQQVHIAAAILSDAKEAKTIVNSQYIHKKIMAILGEAMKMERKEKKKMEQEETDMEATQAWKKLNKAIFDARNRYTDLTDALAKKGWPKDVSQTKVQTFFNVEIRGLREELDTLEQTMFLNKNVIN